MNKINNIYHNIMIDIKEYYLLIILSDIEEGEGEGEV